MEDTNHKRSKQDEMQELHYFLMMDSRQMPMNMNPDLLELGNLAKTMMEAGVIDHTFFTRTW